jgi:hypothetical protein
VFADGDGWMLKRAGGDELRFDPNADTEDAAQRLGEWLRATRTRLAPRALMLTLYIRLFVADQFIHGIGGGRYDQVTDRLIARQFGIAPPHFSVTTATLVFPGAAGRSRACVPCVLQEAHRHRHNALDPRKRELARQIAGLPRRSPERQMLFFEMHQQLNRAISERGSDEWDRRLREARVQEMEDQQFFDRELFYGIQSKGRLEGIIAD